MRSLDRLYLLKRKKQQDYYITSKCQDGDGAGKCRKQILNSSFFFSLKKNDKWRCQWPNFVLWEETEQLGIEEAQGCHLHTERGNPATSNSKFVLEFLIEDNWWIVLDKLQVHSSFMHQMRSDFIKLQGIRLSNYKHLYLLILII